MTKMRTLGSTGLQTPALIFGGNVLGWRIKDQQAFDILERFLEAGGTMIDSANNYSNWIPGHDGGESERELGKWLNQRGKRDDVLIATKVGMMDGPGGSGLQPARIAAAVDQSLANMQTDYIDLYYAHQDDPDTPLEQTLEAFSKLVDSGKVKHIAASNYSAPRLSEALSISADNGFARYEVLQPELNLMSRSDYEGALQTLAIDENLGVATYFALASGFLTGKYRSEDDKGKSPRGAMMGQHMNAKGDAVLEAMDSIAEETGATLAQIALAWVAAQDGVTAPIASATSLDQLNELLGSLKLELSADHLERLDSATLIPA